MFRKVVQIAGMRVLHEARRNIKTRPQFQHQKHEKLVKSNFSRYVIGLGTGIGGISLLSYYFLKKDNDPTIPKQEEEEVWEEEDEEISDTGKWPESPGILEDEQSDRHNIRPRVQRKPIPIELESPSSTSGSSPKSQSEK